MILHPYCAPDNYSNTMRSIGNGLIKGTINGILSAEEQLVMSRLITTVDSYSEHNLNITIIDNRSLFTRLKTWYKHRTTDTPFVVIGNQCIKGTLSI